MHPSLSSAPTADAVALYLLTPDSVAGALEALGPVAQGLARDLPFRGERGEVLVLPSGSDDGPAIRAVLLGVGRSGRPASLGGLVQRLPAASYVLAARPAHWNLTATLTAWAEAGYAFTRYKGARRKLSLALPNADATEQASALLAERLARASDLARDLVNTPPMHMGPLGLETAARDLATRFGAAITVTTGQSLIDDNYPLIHAVGRAAVEPPRLIELAWQGSGAGAGAPCIALVGKGVSFDTGGLNLKPEGGMRLMKKDMGGAAHALALAALVMETDLPLRLVVLVPAVENAIGPDAFRPSDIIASRKGLTVEIDNTDAEGRLILADALARASEHEPDLIIDFATLTGAARVALGPDLPPFYTHSESLAADLVNQASELDDPVWRMPLWPGYVDQLKSPIADLKNLGDPGMAGSVIGALFLEPFVSAPEWLHFDIYSWQTSAGGRTAGAAFQAAKAVFGVLRARYGQGETVQVSSEA